ncbi:MAG: hypothetical protein ACOX75_03565 [Lachnospiraceae bacterium]|jgi:hypothetical protein
MKKILKVLAILTIIGLVAYAAYLCYVKFIKKSDDEDYWNDLEDWGRENEFEPEVTFADRVKSAAEKQLNKIK